MDRAAFVRSGHTDLQGRFRMGMKGLMVLVASCALIVWAGLSIRDHFAGDPWLRAIRSGDAIERQSAARALSLSGANDAGAAMAALMEALGDEDAGVRAAAAGSLGTLLVRLRARSPSAPIAPDGGKSRLDLAMRGLVPLLSDRDIGVRAAAADSLGMLAARPPSVAPTPEQLAALRDGSNAVRRRTARMLHGCPDATLPPELAAALRDESAEVRAAAARALRSYGTDLDPVIPALFAMMVREEGDVRKACEAALRAAWPTPSLVPALLGLLESRNRAVRYHAAQLLGRIGPEARAAIPALVALSNEPFVPPYYPDPAEAAARAMGQMGPSREAIAALIRMISPERVRRDLGALHVARRFLDAWPKLRPLLAIRPGAEIIGPAANYAWLYFLRKSSRIRSAIEGLGDIGPPAVAAVPALLAAQRTAREARHTMARATIPAALGRIAPNSAAAPEVVAALIPMLDADGFISPEAAEALGHFGKDAAAAIPRLRAIKAVLPYHRDAVAKSLAAIESQLGPDADGEFPSATHGNRSE